MIIRIVQSKGRKDRNVMLPAEILDLLRKWWKARPTRRDAGVVPEQLWLFPGRIDRQPAGRKIARVILTHEAGRDGFWLARFLARRRIEFHVIQQRRAAALAEWRALAP